MRVLTYNIWNYSGGWSRRRELLLDLIRGHDPDVIGFQEIRHNWSDLPGRNQARWLAERSGYHWVYRPANLFWPLPPVTEGLAVLSREPARVIRCWHVPRVRGAGPHRVILHVRVGGTDFFNVHFPLTETARSAESRLLTECVSPSRRAVILGDFNADVHQSPMQFLLDRGFVDLWQALHRPEESNPSWPEPRRIDYILGYGEPAWTGTISAVGVKRNPEGIRPSDHVGILADLH